MDAAYDWAESHPFGPFGIQGYPASYLDTWNIEIIGTAISRVEATRNHALGLVRCKLERAALEEAADADYSEVNLKWRFRDVFNFLTRFRFNRLPQPLPLIQLLCSFGLHRTVSLPFASNAFNGSVVKGLSAIVDVIVSGVYDFHSATDLAREASDTVCEWLNSTSDWTTPLHYASLPHCFSDGRAEALLAAGADPHASVEGGRSPLDLAEAMFANLSSSSSSSSTMLPNTIPKAIQVVIDAAGPWSPRTHHLFPSALRAEAIRYIGPLYRMHAQYIVEGMSFVDFYSIVLAFSIIRPRNVVLLPW